MMDTLQVQQPSAATCKPCPLIWLAAVLGEICMGGAWCVKVKKTNPSRQQRARDPERHRDSERERRNLDHTCTGKNTPTCVMCVLLLFITRQWPSNNHISADEDVTLLSFTGSYRFPYCYWSITICLFTNIYWLRFMFLFRYWSL